MTQPLPANNPTYTGSLFPLAVDQISSPDKEIADAVMAVQQSLLGGGAAGTGLASLSATQVSVGGVSLLGGTGVPAAGLGANGNFYFRVDGGGAGATHIYFKNAGAWIGIA